MIFKLKILSNFIKGITINLSGGLKVGIDKINEGVPNYKH